MKRFTILANLIIIFSFISIFVAVSKEKEYKFSDNELFNNVLNEKLKVDLEELQRILIENPELILKNHPDNQKVWNNPIQGKYDQMITNNTNPESELSVAINPKDTNNLIMAVMRFAQSSFNPLTLPIYYTKDFGQTWKVSTFAALPPIQNTLVLGGGDPVIVFDANGIAHLTWISLFLKLRGTSVDSIGTGMHYAYSTNGGETWIYDYYKGVSHSAYFTSGQIDLSKVEIFDDKQWLATDLNPQSPNFGKTFLTFTRFDQKSSASIINVTSLDENKLFSKPYINVSNSTAQYHQFTSNSFGKNGRFVVTFFGLRQIGGQNVPGIFYTYSDDGKNFTTPKLISNFQFVNGRLITSENQYNIPGVDNSRIYPCIYNAADNNPNSPHYGNIYVVWSSYGIDKPSQTKFNVYLSRSTDNGLSWLPPVELSTEPQTGAIDQFYPSITVNPDGVVIVAWYEQKDDTANDYPTDYVLAFSKDGGKTFTKPIKVNQESTKFTTVGSKNSNFGIGEYNQLVATKHYALPFWSDGRLNNGDLNVYCARVPLDEDLLSVEEVFPIFDNFMEVYPNPIKNILNVKFNNENQKISYSITDLSGKTLLNSETTNQNLQLDLSGYPSGVYFLKAQKNNNIKVIKIQKD